MTKRFSIIFSLLTLMSGTAAWSGTTYPDNVFTPKCSVHAQKNAFDIELKFKVGDVHSMTTPLVADMDGDGTPEIIAVKYNSKYYWEYSDGISIIDVKEQKVRKDIALPPFSTYGTGISLADVDNDGKCEIFVLTFTNDIACYDCDGHIRWSAHANDFHCQLSIADINGDGTPEVICGPKIFNALDGKKLIDGNFIINGTGFCSPHNLHLLEDLGAEKFAYHMFALYDFDNDGIPELCAGNTIYKINITNTRGTSGNSWTVWKQTEYEPNIPQYDGTTVVVDFDNDGDADVVVIGMDMSQHAYETPADENFYVWDGQTSEIIAYTNLTPSKYPASVPCCSDFNGDGKMEVAFSTASGLNVLAFDKNEPGNTKFVQKDNYEFHETNSLTAFDFDQDGKEEVVLRDLTRMVITDINTMEYLSNPITAYSGTAMEYPIVADVDGDGHAEIIVCQANKEWDAVDFEGQVAVYGSKTPDAWSSARKVWNQYNYSPVDINEDMTVPSSRFDIETKFANGERPYNAFLKQMPYIDEEGNLFNVAPDLIIVNCDTCARFTCDSVYLLVKNQGEAIAENGFVIDLDDYPEVFATFNDVIGTNMTLPVRMAIPANIIEAARNKKLKFSVTSLGPNLEKQPDCDYSNDTTEFLVPSKASQKTELEEVICEGETYIFDGTPLTQSGDYTTIHPGPENSCTDTTVVLHLTVLKSISFSFKATIKEGDSYLFGDDDLTESGEYSRTETTSLGCDSTILLTLNVTPKDDDKVIPTVFSPSNKDGVNDVFMTGYEVFIYDRYGKLIAHSTNGWDGTYRGEYADPGVYVYHVIMKDKKEREGTVEVLKN